MVFVVYEFFVCFGCEFEIWFFDNCIYWVGFLVKFIVNVFCYVDVVVGGLMVFVVFWFCFNGDCLGWINCFI